MIASTFWKNTIPLWTGWDQFDRLQLLVVVGEVAGGVEELLRHDRGAQPDASRARRSPVSPTAPPPLEVLAHRARRPSSTTVSPSSRPTRPSSNVTSFMATPHFRVAKVAFTAGEQPCPDEVDVKRPPTGAATRNTRSCRASAVVADQGQQLEQRRPAEHGARPRVPLVVEVARGRPGCARCRPRPARLVGQRLEAAARSASSSSSVRPTCAADRLVGVPLERRVPVGRGDDQDGDLAGPVGQRWSRTAPPSRAPAVPSRARGCSRNALNGPSRPPSSSTSRNSCGPCARRPPAMAS